MCVCVCNGFVRAGSQKVNPCVPVSSAGRGWCGLYVFLLNTLQAKKALSKDCGWQLVAFLDVRGLDIFLFFYFKFGVCRVLPCL